MHDCQEVEHRMIDLIFGELSETERLRLTAEIDGCSVCLTEYRSMNGAVRVFDEAWDASLPDEGYWARHQEALRQNLARNAQRASANRAPFWRHLLTLRLPLPVPVAALIAIALLSLSALALRTRSAARVETLATQPLPVAPAPLKVREVPVYHEKVVTRTVYIDRKAREKNEARANSRDKQRVSLPLTANKEKESSIFMRARLTDFQPPDEMRIRVIRRSKDDAN